MLEQQKSQNKVLKLKRLFQNRGDYDFVMDLYCRVPVFLSQPALPYLKKIIQSTLRPSEPISAIKLVSYV